MSDFSIIIDGMTWSYSRLKSFLKCPYGFFIHYILGDEEEPTFLSSYGSFIHEIHEKVFKGEISKQDAPVYYLEHFNDSVTGAPPKGTFQGYYRGALDYMSNFPKFEGKIVSVEEHFDFDINGYKFTGFSDLITRTDKGLVLYDHKAKALKPFSGKAKPTKTDIELTEYYRQLYLYAYAIKQKYGEYPCELVFNCYKSRSMVRTPFVENDMQEALDWACGVIEKIRGTAEWLPDIDYFTCNHLCGMNEQCDFK